MNANDQLREYNCTDNYYCYNFGLLITDGAKALAEQFKCFWFLDIIASYQSQLRGIEFQSWTLVKEENNSAVVTCTDGNENELVIRQIPFTDFSVDTATVWVENGIALLPSEH
jgi:hypothetical protein